MFEREMRDATEKQICAVKYSVGWGQRGWAAGQKHSHTSLRGEAEVLQEAMLLLAQVIQSCCNSGVTQQSHASPSHLEPVPEPRRRQLKR